MNINSHILRISGNAELPNEVILGDNYEVKINGTIVKTQDSDNHDGTYDRLYTLKPILVETVDNQGQSIKAKDTRSESQLLRGILKKIWIDNNIDEEFEKWYSKAHSEIRKHLNQIVNGIL
jgi:hypothetical protein